MWGGGWDGGGGGRINTDNVSVALHIILITFMSFQIHFHYY
jgi:hypothetical protein